MLLICKGNILDKILQNSKAVDMVYWFEMVYSVNALMRVFSECIKCIRNVNFKWDCEFLTPVLLLFFLPKVFTARMASTGQAFWYVRTWWRGWTGGKGLTPFDHSYPFTIALHDNANHTNSKASQRSWPISSDFDWVCHPHDRHV